LVNNPSLYSCKYCYNWNKICQSSNSDIADSVKTVLTCFLGQVARYWHQPEDYSLWLKLMTEIDTTDSLVVLTALYSFTL